MDKILTPSPRGWVPTFVGMTIKKNEVALGLPLILFFALPLSASIFFALGGLFDITGWTAFLSHPQLWPALQLALFTGLISTGISLFVGLLIVSGLYQTEWWPRLSTQVGSMLAVPHLALAVGVSFLIMPSGFIARAIAVFAGWAVPPNWVTTHDPYGVALVTCLVIKETPFLIWILASVLNHEDVQRDLAGQRAVALSLGHNMTSIWLRVFLPQILPKLLWPVFVVFTYAVTVVDMALVIGPTQPPTLAIIVWTDINDAEVLNNARGGVGAIFLSLAIALAALFVWSIGKMLAARRKWLTVGPSFKTRPRLYLAPILILKFFAIYALAIATLVLLSFAPLWPFPQLWPQTLNATAWLRVWSNPSALITSLALAFATTAPGLTLIVAWMESQPKAHDKIVLVLSATALGLPAILVSLGQYRAFLHVGLTGTVAGLFLAHLIPVTAYMFIVLAGPYRSFDPRWRSSASGLLASFPRFLWSIKMPLLKAPLLAASAIGFAVCFSQYVPAQLISAGRYSTLPMEAVTLTSGTNRPLTAAFTLLLMVPPLLAFVAAAYFGRSRWRAA